MTSPAGAILLSTATMFLAIAASTLLLRDRARGLGELRPPSPTSMPRSFGSSMSLRGFDEPPLLIRPALRCDAGRRSMPLTPPSPLPSAAPATE